MSKKQYVVGIRDLPEHERAILRMIFAVSRTSEGRANTYALPENTLARADIVVCDANSPHARTAGAAPRLLVADYAPERMDTAVILRPLIATRVLAALDDVVATALAKPTEPAAYGERRAPVISAISAVPAAQESDNATADVKAPRPATNTEVTQEISEHLQAPPGDDKALEYSATVAKLFAEIDAALLEMSIPTLDEPVPLPAIPTENEARDAHHARKQRALVVDDNPAARKQLGIELVYFDVEVEYAASARQALEMIEVGNYDVAILNSVLPDWDGYQICKRIKAKTKRTRVVMLTGSMTPADKLKGTLAGCNAYLTKPINRLMFQTTMKNYLPMASGTKVSGI